MQAIKARKDSFTWLAVLDTSPYIWNGHEDGAEAGSKVIMLIPPKLLRGRRTFSKTLSATR